VSRKSILERACNAIKASAVRIGSAKDLLAIKHVGKLFAERALVVLCSESFQCYTNQTAEIGKIGSILLKVLCESQTDLNITELLAQAQTFPSGNHDAELVNTLSTHHKLTRVFLNFFFYPADLGMGLLFAVSD
jgi:hypothetical protein